MLPGNTAGRSLPHRWSLLDPVGRVHQLSTYLLTWSLICHLGVTPKKNESSFWLRLQESFTVQRLWLGVTCTCRWTRFPIAVNDFALTSLCEIYSYVVVPSVNYSHSTHSASWVRCVIWASSLHIATKGHLYSFNIQSLNSSDIPSRNCAVTQFSTIRRILASCTLMLDPFLAGWLYLDAS